MRVDFLYQYIFIVICIFLFCMTSLSPPAFLCNLRLARQAFRVGR